MTQPVPPDLPRSRRPTVWGLLVVSVGAALILPLVGFAILAPFAGGLDAEELSILAQVAANWTAVLVILAIVLRGELLPLSSIGFVRPQWRDLGLGVAGWIVALLATGVLASLSGDIDEGPVEKLLALPFAFRLILFLTAGITEEILFRGYALERLATLTRSTWNAAVITCSFFVLLHAPFYGFRESLLRIPVTVILTLVYLRTRSLWTVIVMHLLFDLPLVLVGILPGT